MERPGSIVSTVCHIPAGKYKTSPGDMSTISMFDDTIVVAEVLKAGVVELVGVSAAAAAAVDIILVGDRTVSLANREANTCDSMTESGAAVVVDTGEFAAAAAIL